MGCGDCVGVFTEGGMILPVTAPKSCSPDTRALETQAMTCTELHLAGEPAETSAGETQSRVSGLLGSKLHTQGGKPAPVEGSLGHLSP